MTPRGNNRNSYGGHINDGKLFERLKTFYPESFSNTILDESNSKYPINLLSEEYNINYRYEVDKWIDENFCEKIQSEILEIEKALIRLRREGII